MFNLLQSRNGLLIDLVYKTIRFNDLVANMSVFKDLATAQLCFHIAKTFSKYQRMQTELMNKKKEIIEFIMDCLRDPEISVLDKRQALQLIPFFSIDQESVDIFTRLRLEESLLDVLKNPLANDGVVSQALKAIVMMHASSIAFDKDASVGKVFSDKDGVLLVLQLLDRRMADEKLHWKVVLRIVQALFVLCFRDSNVKTLKQENVLRKLVDLVIRAHEQRVNEAVVAILKLFTFFSEDQTTWS